MYKIIVTEELARIIKEKRLSIKKTAKELAEQVKIKPVYISKLENGYIKTISSNLFYNIIQLLFGNSSEEETLKRIYETLEFWYSKEEIDKQLWFLNFDTVKRLIPINPLLIKHINEKLVEFKIDRNILLTRMNSNEALTEEQKCNKKLDYNKWYLDNPNDARKKIIKIKIEKEQLDNILDGKLEKSAFITIFSICFYINKIIEFEKKIELDFNEYQNLVEETKKELFDYDFSSLQYKNERLKQANSPQEYNAILSRFDKENYRIMNSIIKAFNYASDLDVKLTNERLSEFVNNLKWDLGFMLKLVSLDYRTNVDNLEKKRNLLTKIEKLVEEYKLSVKNSFSDAILSRF